jgi:apolipoprotein N-acyltransferase
MQMPSFERAYGSGQVHTTTGQTPFMRIGNSPLYLGIVLLLLFHFRHLGFDKLSHRFSKR